MPIFYSLHQSRMELFEIHNCNVLTHLHSEVEIVYVKQGSVQVMIDAQEYTLQQGALYIALPDSVHSVKSLGESSCLFLLFHPELLREFGHLMHSRCACPVLSAEQVDDEVLYCLQGLIDRLPVADQPVSAGRHFPNLHQEMPVLFKDFSGITAAGVHPDISSGLLKGYLYLIFSRIMQHMEFVTLPSTATAYVIQTALKFVFQQFKRSITLKELAEHLGVSHYYLSRVFNRYVGCGFCEYLNRLRVEYSQYLLAQSESSIQEIAGECGFDSQRNFNRVFKSFMQCSPSEYRNQKCREQSFPISERSVTDADTNPS